MPKKKKSILAMTKDELAKRFFPKQAKQELDKIAHEQDNKPVRRPSQR